MIGDGRYIGKSEDPDNTGLIQIASTSGPDMFYNEKGIFCGYIENV